MTFQVSKQHFAGRDLQTTFEYLILFISDLASVYTQNQQMDNFKTNKFGRSFISGKPLSKDFRVLILDTIIEKGGDSLTGYIPVTYIEIAKRFCVSQQTVAKIWREFCQRNSFAVQSRGGLRINNRKLTDNDLELIETLKANKGSISMREISEILEEFGDVQGGIAMSTISRAIKSRLLSGKKYSRKKITHVALQRFTFTNILYTQLFVNYLSSKDARKVFRRSGYKVTRCRHRLYGHAPVGERCVEVERKLENPNTTLNLLVSLNGVEYYNMLDGATDTVQFLNFFEEAANAVNFETTRPALEVGDIVVMDNLAVHHYEGGELLEEYLADMGIELLFTPVYSPDLNPVELCFNKIKTQLNYNFQKVFKANLKLATVLALETITVEDMSHFYNLTSYLFEL